MFVLQGNIDAATPEIVVTNAMKHLDFTMANKVRYKNALPLPPGQLMKKNLIR